MGRYGFVFAGAMLFIIAIVAYSVPLSFTLAGENMSTTIPKMVAICDSGLGQFAQLSPEMAILCTEFKNYLLGIYGVGLLGIILIIIGAVAKGGPRRDAEGNPVEEDINSIEILKKRYAKGEISKEEFDKIRNDLGGNTPIQNYEPVKSAIKKDEDEIEKLVPKSSWKSPILKGVIIGIIASSIIWGSSFAATYQTFVMIGDKMEPTIMDGDIMRYSKTPFSQISENDIIAFTNPDDSSKVLVNKVIRASDTFVQVTNEEKPNVRIVSEDQYIGKINSIEESWGPSSVILNPISLLFLTAISFVIPIVILKIYGSGKS